MHALPDEPQVEPKPLAERSEIGRRIAAGEFVHLVEIVPPKGFDCSKELAGAALLFGYGASLNLAPLEFGQVVGLYIATLFVIWQIINFIAFRSVPSLPILVGGLFIVIGGSIVTFWKT